ncbi:MAG: hypothetical protein Q9163_004165 [Psora crenata]
MSRSFRRHSGLRPLRYRTPSPPRHAYEPISQALNGDPTTNISSDSGHIGALKANDLRRECLETDSFTSASVKRLDQRSNEFMNMFADIALATQSPKPSLHTNAPTSKSRSHDMVRSHQRAKSEKLPSPEMSHKANMSGIRPATSCEQSLDNRMMEAELLLNFSQRASQACPRRTNYHVNTEKVQHVSNKKLSAPQHLPLQIKGHYGSNIVTERSSPITRPLPEMQLSAAIDEQINTIAGGGSPGSLNIVATQNTRTSAKSLRLLTTHGLIDVTGEGSAGQIATGHGENNTPEPHHEHFSAQDICASMTPLDRNMGVHTTLDSDRFESGASSIRNERVQGQARAEAQRTGEPHREPDVADRLRTIQGSLAPTADKTTADLVDTSMDNEQPSPAIVGNSIVCDTPKTPLVPTHSPILAAVCAVCNFTQNSLSIDSRNNATSWISCDGCKSWFHFACAGFKNEREVRCVDKYRCCKCKPLHGTTTYVRKSSRAHSAIDYAGLHHGVIKTSDDTPEHHYIQPIKDGTIMFLPDTFARMRPELVTAEYFEKGIGMREPVVIPAAFNPQPMPSTSAERLSHLAEEAHSPSTFERSASSEEWFPHEAESQRVPDEGQDGLDMVMPQGLTVRKVAELYGLEEKVEVIDVKSQNGEHRKWNMRRWADYYENQNDNKIVRNVISLEVSQSRLGRLIRRPQIVRDLDLQDSVWPGNLLAKGDFPRVQFYCLMSVADCFTDFHIDFGGSSVFYHILKGKKTFFFIPPKEKNLKKYEEWCMSPAQNWSFLPDRTKECYRVDLSEGDTMLIPSGWIHAVWTPEDSLVIGGNFLTRMNYGMQLRIAQVEKATGVARKFRYPHFQKLHWYTALRYLEDDPLPQNVRDLLETGGSFHRSKPTYYEFDDWGQNSRSGPECYNARYYSQPELDGLPDLTRYLLRTALIDIGCITEGINLDTRNAVKKSIPRGHGEPLHIVKTFAIWCAWKRGNEPIPHWAYPDAVPEIGGAEKLSVAASRRLDREAPLKAPRRQSARMQCYQESAKRTATVLRGGEVDGPALPLIPNGKRRSSDELHKPSEFEDVAVPSSKRRKLASSLNTASHRKTACEACRRRRRACKHKDQKEELMSHSQDSNSAQDCLRLDVALGDSVLRDSLCSIGGLFSCSPANAEGTQVVIPSPGPQQRRCIHDAFGNEDPVKVAETAIPRPHARKVNRGEPSVDKHSLSTGTDTTSNNAVPASYASLGTESERRANLAVNVLIAPTANMAATPSAQSDYEATPQGITPDPHITYDTSKEYPDEGRCRGDKVDGIFEKALASTRTLKHRMPIDPVLYSDLRSFQLSFEVTNDDTGLNYGQAPASLLVSPPASSHDDVGNSPAAPEGLYTSLPSSSRQGSQQPKGHFQRYTPESGSIRRSSHSSCEDRPLKEERPRIGGETLRSARKQSRGYSALEADDESLRLIKELQAQDLGLRRRG